MCVCSDHHMHVCTHNRCHRCLPLADQIGFESPTTSYRSSRGQGGSGTRNGDMESQQPQSRGPGVLLRCFGLSGWLVGLEAWLSCLPACPACALAYLASHCFGLVAWIFGLACDLRLGFGLPWCLVASAGFCCTSPHPPGTAASASHRT